MTALQQQMDFFADNSDLGLIRQDFILLHSSTEKVRRGVYAKVTEQQKQIVALKSEIEALKNAVQSLCAPAQPDIEPVKNTRRSYHRRQENDGDHNEEYIDSTVSHYELCLC